MTFISSVLHFCVFLPARLIDLMSSQLKNISRQTEIEWRNSQKDNDDICLPLCLLFLICIQLSQRQGKGFYWLSSDHRGVGSSCCVKSRSGFLSSCRCVLELESIMLHQVCRVLFLVKCLRKVKHYCRPDLKGFIPCAVVQKGQSFLQMGSAGFHFACSAAE